MKFVAEFRDGNIVERWLRKMSLILPILFLWFFSALVLIVYFFSETSARGRRSEADMQRQRRRRPSSSARISENQHREPNHDEHEEVDCIIVGAGVAGAALACTLAKDGRKVKVFERDLSEPDRIVGELLQPGGYMKLLELGLEDCVEEIDAQHVFGYAIFSKEENTKVSYPLEGFASDICGRGFHNGRFVQKMRTKAASNPLIQLEQANVLSLVESEGIVRGVRYRSSEGEEKCFYAPMTFVCDGSFSNLRRAVSNSKVKTPSWFVGLIVENPASLPYPSYGHVILADPSPLLFYPISSTEVRCLVDIPGESIPSGNNGQLKQYLRNVIADQLPLKLRNPFLDAVDKCKIRSMPNKSMAALPRARPGVLMLGDAFNMRHPLTGGGMTVALSDIVILRDILRPVKDFSHTQSLCNCLQDFYIRRKPVASTINILADSLYKVFSASDPVEEERRKACFKYLSLGGVFASGPMGLLGAIDPSIAVLIFHFLMLTGYGLVCVLSPFPSPSRLWTAARLVWKAPDILLPSLRNEGFLPTLSLKKMLANKSTTMWIIFIFSTIFLLAWML